MYYCNSTTVPSTSLEVNRSLTKHNTVIITRGRAAASGYSSLLVCLFVCLFVMGFSTHLDAIALRLQHR